jgi:hypothetical protein
MNDCISGESDCALNSSTPGSGERFFTTLPCDTEGAFQATDRSLAAPRPPPRLFIVFYGVFQNKNCERRERRSIASLTCRPLELRHRLFDGLDVLLQRALHLDKLVLQLLQVLQDGGQ